MQSANGKLKKKPVFFTMLRRKRETFSSVFRYKKAMGSTMPFKGKPPKIDEPPQHTDEPPQHTDEPHSFSLFIRKKTILIRLFQ